MAFVKKTWKDRIAEFPTRRRLTKEDNTSELVTVAREEGTLSQEGDAFSAENMNDLENRIDAEFTAVNGNLNSSICQETSNGLTCTWLKIGDTIFAHIFGVTETLQYQYGTLFESDNIPCSTGANNVYVNNVEVLQQSVDGHLKLSPITTINKDTVVDVFTFFKA